MKNTAANDITGDPIHTKASTPAYREGYDRIFGPPPAAPITPESILSDYINIGSANGCSFKKPEGKWVRFQVSKGGNREWYCNHKLKQYYDNYCD